jgi:hypothetical protein
MKLFTLFSPDYLGQNIFLFSNAINIFVPLGRGTDFHTHSRLTNSVEQSPS